MKSSRFRVVVLISAFVFTSVTILSLSWPYPAFSSTSTFLPASIESFKIRNSSPDSSHFGSTSTSTSLSTSVSTEISKDSNSVPTPSHLGSTSTSTLTSTSTETSEISKISNSVPAHSHFSSISISTSTSQSPSSSTGIPNVPKQISTPSIDTINCENSSIADVLYAYSIGVAPAVDLSGRLAFYLEEFKRLRTFKNVHHGYCRNHPSDFLREKQLRYHHIQKTKKYVAANLHNNEDILPDMMYNFLVMANESISGQESPPLSISIYESGSKDKSKCLLRILHHALQNVGVENSIIMDETVRGPEEHRIEYLSKVRNRALQKFGDYNGHVLFLNDVLFCVDDMYELLFQAKRQKAALTCGIDYWQGVDPVIYDLWVHRDLAGLPPRTISAPLPKKLAEGRAFDWKNSLFDTFTLHPATSLQLASQVPLPVACCWNGAAVIDSDVWRSDGGIKFRAANMSSGECDQSECSLLCKDIVGKGNTRIMLVPRVKVAYQLNDFHNVKDPHSQTEYTRHFPPNKNFTAAETEGLLDFSKFPELVMCLPLKKHKGAKHLDPYTVVYEKWLPGS